MCEISNKLKLCSCAKNIDELPHVWELHRFVKGRKVFAVGEAMMPSYIDPKIDNLNRITLIKLVNGPNIFDKPFEFKDKDLLALSFNCSEFEMNENYLSVGSRITYGFEYKKGKWIEKEHDFFLWMEKHEELFQGKIEVEND